MKPLRHTFKVQTSKETLFNLGNFCISSDGKYLICVFSNLVNIVEIETGLVKHTLESEEEEISSVALSPNDEHLITAHYTSLLLKQWSNWKQFPEQPSESKTQTKCTRTWKAVHTSPILSMSFDSSSSLLATSSSDYTTKIWDLNAQYCTHNLKGVSGITRCVRFYPDVRRKQEIVLAGDDAKLRVYDLNTSRMVACLDGHFSVITCFEYLGEKWDRILSASRDKVLILWDMTTSSKLRTIPTFEPIESLELLPGVPNYALTMGNAGVLKLWNIESGRLVYTQDQSQSVKSSSSTRSTSESADLEPCIIQSKWVKPANSVVMLTVDESIVFVGVDASLMKKLAKEEGGLSDDELKRFFNPYKQYIGNHGEILDAKFADCHERLLAVATNSSDLKIYDLDNWDCKVLKGHKDLIICLAAYKDRANKRCYLASSSKDSEIRIWQVWSTSSSERPSLSSYHFDLLQVCLGHTQDVGALAFSKQSFDFLVSGSIDTTIKLWRIEEAKSSSKSKKDKNHGAVKLGVAFTAKAHEKDINCVCVSSNDKLVASGSTDKTAKIWDSNDGSCLAVLRGHRRGIWSVEFSSVEQLIATSSADATIKLWTLNDYTCIKTFEGHNTSVLKVFFLNQSSQLISCASDGLIKLWNIKTSGCVASFDEHADKCWSLVLSENEERLISGGADGKLIVWRDVTDEMLEEELEQREEVLLKEQELENFMQEKNWKKALRLALVLDKPFRCYSIIKEILEMRNVEDKDGVNLGRLTLEKTLKSLRDDQIRSLLKYASEWNTNTKYCRLAQVVFELIMRNYSPDMITQDGTNNEFAKQIIEQFLPYTERHCARLNRLAQQVMFIDFTWKNMKLDDVDAGRKKEISFNNNNNLSINE